METFLFYFSDKSERKENEITKRGKDEIIMDK
jgi:hypothetical protein